MKEQVIRKEDFDNIKLREESIWCVSYRNIYWELKHEYVKSESKHEAVKRMRSKDKDYMKTVKVREIVKL